MSCASVTKEDVLTQSGAVVDGGNGAAHSVTSHIFVASWNVERGDRRFATPVEDGVSGMPACWVV